MGSFIELYQVYFRIYQYLILSLSEIEYFIGATIVLLYYLNKKFI